MAHMDIFNDKAFSMSSLEVALDKTEFQPSFLGDLNLFTPTYPNTSKITIEEQDGALALVGTSPRGVPAEGRKRKGRKIITLEAPRIANADFLTAEEIAGIRAFGSETELRQVSRMLNDKINGPAGIRSDIELTWEHMRLGAINGVVLDADGSTEIVNWYTVMNVSAPSTVYFDFDAASPAEGAILQKCHDIVRAVRRAAKGGWIEGRTYIMALCGDTFYDKLTRAPEVREIYKNQVEASLLRNDVGVPWETFRYGGIIYVNYRGTDDNSTVAVGVKEARFFPVAGRDVFRVAWTPGESFQSINRPGRELYPVLVRDKDRDWWVKPELYSYPLFMCTRPGMLQLGSSDAAP